MAGGMRVAVTEEMVAEAEAWGVLGWWPAEMAEAWGVTDRTLRNWRTRGREGEEPFAALDAAIRRGEARNRSGHLGNLNRAAQGGSVAASTWVLDRRHGWGERAKAAATMEAATDAGVASPEALESLLRRVAETSPHLLRRVLAEAEREATGAPVQEPEGVE